MSEFVLQAQGINKSFPGVKALEDVDFDLRPGEVHVLLGENGAGKSTLVKILTGVYQKDAGSILVNGQPVEIRNPHEALDLGISVIYQELSAAPHLDVARNIYLGRFPALAGRIGEIFGFVDWSRVYGDSKRLLRDLDIDVDVHALAGAIPTSKVQMVEIARALSMNSRIIFMDEPTSSISLTEQEELFRQIRRLREQGVAIVYISHRLEEILKIGDRITVLRDGSKIGTVTVEEADNDLLVQMIVGRQTKERYPKTEIDAGEIILEVRGLTRHGILRDINFSLRRGEILGMAGLVGSGRTDVARAIFGADKVDEGEIHIFGQRVTIRSPQDAMNYGMAFLTEDRKREGLLLDQTILRNMISAAINCERVSHEFTRGWSLLGFIAFRDAREKAQDYAKSLELKTPSLLQEAQYLSGGNQQKVVLAKWLMTKAEIFVFDEPTRGIDVGTKPEVYRLMQELARRGAGVIMISSEMEEVVAISDRILVMSRGMIAAEIPRSEATEEKIMRYAATAPDTSSPENN